MARWLVFFRERFPIVPHLLLCGGIACSAGLLVQPELALGSLCLATVGLLVFMLVLRMMDEEKDFKKDTVANPQRPLPRGLISRREIHVGVQIGVAGMIGFAVLSAVIGSLFAGGLYLGLTAYLWLMYREFYVGSWLNDKPFLYGFSHQVVLLPFCGFAVAVYQGAVIHQPSVWAFSVAILGAFFCYEIARKLDPKADPILGTYLVVCGRRETVAAIGATALVAGAGGFFLGLWFFSGPILVLLLATSTLLFYRPERFKIVEGVATLSLLVHVWMVALGRWMDLFSQ